jgi:PrcB C-terminal
MNKILLLFIITLFLFGCKSNPTITKTNLYEILYQGENGGESYNFYEVITDEKDFRKVLSEELIINKVKKDDIIKNNFLYLSLGEKNSGGFGISVSSVEELSEKIIVKIAKTTPKPDSFVTTAITYPFCIVKINSKKPIEIQD